MEEIRILINDERPEDAYLLEQGIRKAGFSFTAKRVEARDAFLAALREFAPDIIISDCHFKAFDGMQALDLANEHLPLVPFIIATSILNEEVAVQCMMAGADDYVLKEYPLRIGPAIGVAMSRKKALRERIDIEHNLAASERKFRAIFECVNDAILLLNDFRIVDCNPTAERLFGYGREHLLGRYPLEFSPEFQKDGISSREMRKEIEKKSTGDFFQSFQWRFINSDGIPFDVEAGLTPAFIDGIRLDVAVMRDITEKKRTEIELRESEKKYRRLSREFNALLDVIPDMILLQSPDQRILWANKAALANLGGHAESDADRYCYRLVHGLKGPVEDCPVIQCLRTGEPAKSILPMREGTFWEVRAIPVRDEGAGIVSVLEIGRDITEIRKLEQQLIHAQKMEAVAQLSSGIAHDFNNIATALIGYANLLLMHCPEESQMRHFAGQILVTSERAADLVKKILAFGRKKVFNLEQVDIARLVVGLRDFLERVIGEEIKITTEFHDEDLYVTADCGQMEQALMNLVTNAKDAMPDGGLISISTSRKALDLNFIETHGFGEEGTYACITLSDTGTGMEQSTMKRIFEPFYTTKEPGKGTGLGLSIVYEIVKGHHGFITVDSAPGEGTTFRIYLPLSKERHHKMEIHENIPRFGGAETILLAEDDEMARRCTASFLSGFGYRIIEAADGAEALRLFAEFKDELDLLILDVVLPLKGGREVAETARGQRSDIRVLFNSGYPLDVLQYKGVLDKGVNFFLKPMDPLGLLKKVREVLDE